MGRPDERRERNKLEHGLTRDPSSKTKKKKKKEVWVTVSRQHEHWALSTQTEALIPPKTQPIDTSINHWWGWAHQSAPHALYSWSADAPATPVDPKIKPKHTFTMTEAGAVLCADTRRHYNNSCSFFFSSVFCPGNKVKAAAAASTPNCLSSVQCESWSSVHLRRLSGKKRKKKKRSWRRFYFILFF